MYKAVKTRVNAGLCATKSMKSAMRGNHVGIIMRNAGHYRGWQVLVRKFAIGTNVGYVWFRTQEVLRQAT